MRIVSLVPHATELLFALGAGPEVLGVTHECDYPPAARELAQLTRDALPGGLSAAEIDAAVRERTLAGESIYELDRDALADLEPELIVTQALCPVCGGPTSTAHPPRFSPEDRYGEYRRRAKGWKI